MRCQTGVDFFFYFLFLFFGDHPCFLLLRTSSLPSTFKSTSEFERPDFVIKIVEKPINLALCKVAIRCPDFCFSKYGNPKYKRMHFNSYIVIIFLTCAWQAHCARTCDKLHCARRRVNYLFVLIIHFYYLHSFFLFSSTKKS